VTVPETPRDELWLEPGAVVAGKLEIVRRIGEGGMGAVYEVVHQITKHHRAMKVLHPEAGAKAGLVERFFREASAAGRIGNAHIAETFDAGTLANGEPFLVMELLHGETLAARIARGPIDAAELADFALQACDGVAAAHEAGIIHRDLKPENLFITQRDGRAFLKILDFGVSKFQETESVRALTSDGALIGTPFYMPPEQLEGRGVIDARVDVYALGVILYECAARRRPFEASTLPHLAVLIHEAKPTPLAGLRPDLPAELIAAITRAMHPDPEARFPAARAFADAIAASLPGPQAAMPGSTPSEAPTLLSDAPPPPAVPSANAPSSEVALSRSRFELPRSRAWWLLAPLVLFGLVFGFTRSRSGASATAPEAVSLSAVTPAVSVPPPALGLEVRSSPPASAGPPSVSVSVSVSASASASAVAEKRAPKPRATELAPPAASSSLPSPEPVSGSPRAQKRGLETANPFR
jgi:eukaryotic-like serine/threonine-protein kinase